MLAPLLAAIVAGAAVAGISLATDSTPTSRSPSSKSSSNTTAGLVAPVGTALQSAFVEVVQSVSPSVVQIEDQQGLGSGIVLDAAGDIVTNNHVVSGATSFIVTTSSGNRYPAKLVGSFPPDDVAVIKVSGAHLRPATFADSSKLDAGDLAIAIGNPLGLRSSVTEGIVSAFRQAVQEERGDVTLPSVIQTSAAINPGNSGGALVDIEGRVIGISTLAATDPQLGGGSAPGIGFAIPSNVVKDIAGQILAHGKVVDSHRAFLGIRVGDTNGNGVLVGAVTAGGAAEKGEHNPPDREDTMQRNHRFGAASAAIATPWVAAAAALATLAAIIFLLNPPETHAAQAQGPVVSTVRTSLGRILVNSQGRTLYLFGKDRKGKSACTGKCATFWPPMIASGKPRVAGGAKASLVGTTKRADARLQVTYNHHPLYTFAKDKRKGQTSGEEINAFGGVWYAVSPAGAKIVKHGGGGY